MDINSSEIKWPHLSISKEEFFAHLSNVDKDNVQTFASLLGKFMRKKGKHGALIVVGGILTKPQPRKDIDIRIVIEPDNDEHKIESFPNLYNQAIENYQTAMSLVSEVITTNSSLTLAGSIMPAIDEEFQNQNILKHEGSIKLSVDKGTPIELLLTPGLGVDKTIIDQKAPYCLITKI